MSLAAARNIFLLPLFVASLHAGITLQVSSETALAPGTAQFKISLTAPSQVSSGGLSMSFAPAFFGPVQSIAAFSATGDQTGYAMINGNKVSAYFSSASASIGQLPDLPVFVITVGLIPTAVPGTATPVTLDPTAAPWLDAQGKNYTVTVNPGTFTVGGPGVSIGFLTPSGGLLPAGAIVDIYGQRFDSSATVSIDGVSIASATSDINQIHVTLVGPANLTGKHVRVTDQGESVDYVNAPYAPTTFGTASLALILPTFPFATQTSAEWSFPDNYNFTYYGCLQNPTEQPVTVNYYDINGNNQITATSFVVPSYGLTVVNNGTLANTLGTLYMTASAPLRMMQMFVRFGGAGPAQYGIPSRVPSITTVNEFGGLSLNGPPFWIWQLGQPAPKPVTATVVSAFPFTISLTGGAQGWLSVSQTSFPAGTSTFTLTPQVSVLGAGNYTGTVTSTYQMPPELAAIGPITSAFVVTLYASAQPTIISASPASFSINLGDPNPPPQTITLATDGTPAPFTDSVTCSSGGNWLSVTPSSGTTPGPLTLTPNTTGLGGGIYNCNILIQGPVTPLNGPVNALTVPVQLLVNAGIVDTTPTSLTFTLAPGQTAPSVPQQVKVELFGTITASVTTQSGGNWLTATPDGLAVDVNASAVGLSAGTYQGTVNISLTGAIVRHATVPVTLIVMTPTPPPTSQMTVSPSALMLSGPAGGTAMGTINVNLVSGPPTFTVSATIGQVTPIAFTYTAPASIQIEASGALPGIYKGTVTISWAGGSATIPVTNYVTASPSIPPVISQVVASGSATTGSIAPGELVTIYGTGLANAPGSNDFFGVQFNGINAPLIYASLSQLNVVVPFEVGSTGTANLQVIAAGQNSSTWAIPLAPSAPSIFTLNASGIGPGAIVNQDGSINSPSNPAARGSFVQIYATGGGQTSPASSTGATASAAAGLILPVAVYIGGSPSPFFLPEPVLYAGNAPGEIEGVAQINAIVPAGITPGPALPLTITIGGVPSRTGVTIAVQ